MKIYIHRAQQEDIDMFDLDGLNGPDDSGDYYYQYVEYGTNPGEFDEFAIADGCGRMVPISIESIDELISALQAIKEVNYKIKEAEEFKEKIASEGTTYVSVFGEVDWDTESLQIDSSESF
ncbi:hypothetical protein UFOVP218_106 [uncultured Caudovirales phage]|uniref:Uncharacterized protein n=1 Tax=uncultured Caudovirales phage TaxID=2100421 RepID=A0A6J7WKZ4_9CAUD|nr:hypothetical protein UFOVP218_106 [uncultured Caudovirales phage]